MAGLVSLVQKVILTPPKHQKLLHNLQLDLELLANMSLSLSLAQKSPFPAYRHLGYKQGSQVGKMHKCIWETYFVSDVFMEGRRFSIYIYMDIAMQF